MYRRFGLPGAAGAIAGGTLVDLDHLVDYTWARLHGARSHYLAPLHGWELAFGAGVLAALAARASAAETALPDRLVRRRRGVAAVFEQPWAARLLAGLSAGLWLHLLQDLVSNRPRHPGVYALTYRLRHGFRREITGWGDHTDFHGWSDQPWYRWF
jgi:hypothetical protein